MSGEGKNKRQRTMNSLRDGRAKKKHKTDNKDKRSDVPGTTRGQNLSTLSVNRETTNGGSNDAKGGRLLRPRTGVPPLGEEAGVPSLSEEEDDPSDKSWKPGSRPANVQRQSLPAKRRKLGEYFKCTDQCMDELFAELGVPVYFENPPPSVLCTKVHKHNRECLQSVPTRIVASNVTQALLAFYAAWVFADVRALTSSTLPSINTAANIYRAISLIASPIPWNVRPFRDPAEQEDGTYKLERNDKPDRDIRDAWWWFFDCLRRGLTLKIPLEWTYFDESIPSGRPEMPDSFSKLLDEEDAVSRPPRSACSSLDGTPVKKFVGILPDSNATVKPLGLGTIKEQDESSSPSCEGAAISSTSQLTSEPSASASPALSLPYFETEGLLPSGIVGAQHDIKYASPRAAELSGFLDPPADRESDVLPEPIPKGSPPAQFELAYSLIAQHHLKETKEDALRLEQYLSGAQRKFDINQSKKQLCSILPPAETHIVFDGDFNDRDFAYVPRAEIEKADELERCGNAGKTENAVDVDDTAMELNYRWLNFKGIDETNLKGNEGLSELDVERKVGRLFVGLFRFDELQESANTTARFLGHLQLFGSSPRPDYAVRPAPGEWSHWPDTLRPIMASGEQKTLKSISKDNEAQIAFNTRALIILQILMYLDTRERADSPLPGWMFNFSWIASHRGFTIYIHYPSINLAKDGQTWSWKMVSVMLTNEYYNVWKPGHISGSRRMRAKALFDKIVSHTSFALDQIRTWSRVRGQYGDGSIMNQLIARAHLEQGDYEWFYKKLEDEEKEDRKRKTCN